MTRERLDSMSTSSSAPPWLVMSSEEQRAAELRLIESLDSEVFPSWLLGGARGSTSWPASTRGWCDWRPLLGEPDGRTPRPDRLTRARVSLADVKALADEIVCLREEAQQASVVAVHASDKASRATEKAAAGADAPPVANGRADKAGLPDAEERARIL